MKNICLLLMSLALFSCAKENKIEYSLISGNIQNNVAETVLIMSNDSENRIAIDENNTFSDTLYLERDGFYDLYIGRARTGIYLEKGKSLSIDLDADQIDQSLKYGGDLADINNFIAEKYLYNKENLKFKEL